jgi:hypothetical protein
MGPPHEHPDSVMYTLSAFRRRLSPQDGEREVELPSGVDGWVPARQHHGENIGQTQTHAIFVELEQGGPVHGRPRGPIGRCSWMTPEGPRQSHVATAMTVRRRQT